MKTLRAALLAVPIATAAQAGNLNLIGAIYFESYDCG